MDIKNFRDLIILAESPREKLVQESLPYGRDDLAPVKSKETIDYHYGKLARGYVDRYNKKEGDDQFNYGGATLHNLYFPQLRAPRSSNRPTDASKEIIDTKWGSFDKFKDAWALDYQHDKQQYQDNFWKIINWDVVNIRLQGE